MRNGSMAVIAGMVFRLMVIGSLHAAVQPEAAPTLAGDLSQTHIHQLHKMWSLA
jgi:hypothetical protein